MIEQNATHSSSPKMISSFILAPSKNIYQLTGLRVWLINHLRSGLLALQDFVKTPIVSLMTLMVIGIAIALPLSLYMLLHACQTLSSQSHGQPTLSLHLKQNVSPEKLSILMTKLSNWPNVGHVHYIASEQGLKEFEHETILSDVLKLLPKNPLPGIFVITPSLTQNTPDSISQLIFSLQQLKEVEVSQLDREWVKRLSSLFIFAKRLTYSIGLLSSLSVILITALTIRLITQQHKKQINIYKLVGATRGFIRRPFLYRGTLIGFFGGIIAWSLIESIIAWLYNPAQQLIQDYNMTLHLPNFHLLVGLSALLIGSLLGLIGSYLAVFPYLRAREEI